MVSRCTISSGRWAGVEAPSPLLPRMRRLLSAAMTAALLAGALPAPAHESEQYTLPAG